MRLRLIALMFLAVVLLPGCPEDDNPAPKDAGTSIDVCTPDCTEKTCGDDGCGNSCGECGNGETCTDDGDCTPASCVPDCAGRICGDDGCGGSCGECADAETCTDDGDCAPTVCLPDCAGRICGDDGCGGSCGECADAETCTDDGACEGCTADCTDKFCGDDGCGGSCGECLGANERCTPAGMCECLADCTGKECGDDGCGGSCGDCQVFEACDPAGLCEVVSEYLCTDGLDDDGDGDIDCADADCNADPACEDCTDAIDNDGDLLIDCDDSDCFGRVGVCDVELNCTDGEDNDLDMVGDCMDTDCALDIACCIPDCAGKICGDDGCGGSCGDCLATETCSPDGAMCVPNCTDDAQCLGLSDGAQLCLGDSVATCNAGADGCLDVTFEDCLALGEICVVDQCQPSAGFGGPCTDHTDCGGTGSPGVDTFCQPSAGGWCTQVDGPDYVAEGVPCTGDPDSVGFEDTGQVWCLEACASDADCRPAYQCVSGLGTGANVDACLPIVDCSISGCNEGTLDYHCGWGGLCWPDGCATDPCQGTNATECRPYQTDYQCECAAGQTWDDSGQTCGAAGCPATLLDFSGVMVATSCNQTDTYDADVGLCLDWPLPGPDDIYELNISAGSTVTIDVTGSAPFDPALMVLNSCLDYAGTTCVDGSDDGFDATAVETVSVSAGGTDRVVYIVVDGWHPNDCGAYEITVN
jgi:hypothetical protein